MWAEPGASRNREMLDHETEGFAIQRTFMIGRRTFDALTRLALRRQMSRSALVREAVRKFLDAEDPDRGPRP